jgi:hypothetical protein
MPSPSDTSLSYTTRGFAPGPQIKLDLHELLYLGDCRRSDQENCLVNPSLGSRGVAPGRCGGNIKEPEGNSLFTFLLPFSRKEQFSSFLRKGCFMKTWMWGVFFGCFLSNGVLGEAFTVEGFQKILSKDKLTQEEINDLQVHFSHYERSFLDRFVEKGLFNPTNVKEKTAVFLSVYTVLFSAARKAARDAAMIAARDAAMIAASSAARKAARKAAISIFGKVDLGYLAGDLKKLAQTSWSLSALSALNWTLTEEAKDLFKDAYDAALPLLADNVIFQPVQALLDGEEKGNPYILMLAMIVEPLPETKEPDSK